jgi:hypothetical protein
VGQRHASPFPVLNFVAGHLSQTYPVVSTVP